MKIAFTDLEENFDVPAFPINPDYLFFIQVHICGNKTKVLLAFIAVTDI
jgi:hypothetical protein